MKKRTVSEAIAALLMLVLISSYGCWNEPRENPLLSQVPLSPDPGSEYCDLTERECVIDNLLQSYKDTNIERYAELLCAGYLWLLQDGDYEPGEDNFIEREADIDMTRNMFLAANGLYEPFIDRLSLEIDPGEWYAIDEIGGEACDDCWETQRHYHIEVVVGETTYIGDDDILVQIVRDPATQKYCIMRIYDIIK